MLNGDEIYRQVIDCGIDWADKKAAYETLDDITKTVLSDIISNYLPPTCPTKSEAEIRALASREYKEHLSSKAAARREWLVSEVKYKGAVMLAELRRTEESTKRAEMGMR